MNEEELLAAVIRSQIEGLEERRSERVRCLLDLYSETGWAKKLNLDVDFLIEHAYGKEYLLECKRELKKILKQRKEFDDTLKRLLTLDLTWQDFISRLMKTMPKNMSERDVARTRIKYRKIWYRNRMNKV